MFNKKSALKLVGFQVALIITLLLTQIAIQFSQTHYWVGFQSKTDGWYNTAMVAQANNSNCQIELQKVGEQIEQFKAIRSANNKDIE